MEVLDLIRLSGDDNNQNVYAVAYDLHWRAGEDPNYADYAEVDEVLKSVGGSSHPLRGGWIVRSTRDDSGLSSKIAVELRKRSLSCSSIHFMLSGTGMDCVFILRWMNG